MTARSTWVWVCVAVGLLACIFVFDRHAHKTPPPPALVLPNFTPAAVTSVQVRLAGYAVPEILAQRTNDTWQLKLSESLVYPADLTEIQKLLLALQHLSQAAYLTATEMRRRPQADTEYGFASPQASIIILQGSDRRQLLVGSKTPPGDQLYVQVVGTEGAYIVDSDFLAAVPTSLNDWRDRAVL